MLIETKSELASKVFLYEKFTKYKTVYSNQWNPIKNSIVFGGKLGARN